MQLQILNTIKWKVVHNLGHKGKYCDCHKLTLAVRNASCNEIINGFLLVFDGIYRSATEFTNNFNTTFNSRVYDCGFSFWCRITVEFTMSTNEIGIRWKCYNLFQTFFCHFYEQSNRSASPVVDKSSAYSLHLVVFSLLLQRLVRQQATRMDPKAFETSAFFDDWKRNGRFLVLVLCHWCYINRIKRNVN